MIKLLYMEKVTIQDVRIAMLKVANGQQTNYLLEVLNDEELFCTNIDDLCIFNGQMENIIRQLGKDKRVSLPHELHKVLPDRIVGTLVNTINFCIQEEEKLGTNLGYIV